MNNPITHFHIKHTSSKKHTQISMVDSQFRLANNVCKTVDAYSGPVTSIKCNGNTLVAVFWISPPILFVIIFLS
jgi:hypothetical protein